MLWRQYGAVGIGTYFGIYFGSIGFFYVVYDYGVLTNLPSGGTAVIEHVRFVLLMEFDETGGVSGVKTRCDRGWFSNQRDLRDFGTFNRLLS